MAPKIGGQDATPPGIGATVEEISDQSEYLCTLQPPPGSAFERELLELRAVCQRELFVDETGLYPPHVSVTGFFTASVEQAASICAIAVELAATRTTAGAAAGLTAEVRGVVATEDGHVLLDIAAPTVARLAEALAERAAALGVHIRPKAVRHLSLASGRPAAARRRVAELFAGVRAGPCKLDLVVSKLLHRSDLEQLQVEGQAHSFGEVLRLPLCPGADRAARAALVARAAPSAWFIDHVVTPMRKRRLESDLVPPSGARTSADATAGLFGASRVAGAVALQEEPEVTPGKVAKTRAGAASGTGSGRPLADIAARCSTGKQEASGLPHIDTGAAS